MNYHNLKQVNRSHLFNLIKIIGAKRNASTRNILNLSQRGYFNEIFPDNAHEQIKQLMHGAPQTLYAGFDPTANSLHIGNLLVIIGLLHCQRAGHNSIALIGGATGQVGDPSGRSSERSKLGLSIVERNIVQIKKQLERIFSNHADFIWTKPKDKLLPVHIVNNADWYRDVNLVDFISTFGRNFRIGQMLSRVSVQTRLQSGSGMSFTEFSYQIFQAYDWYHLFKTNGCKFQLGGSDQMGNIMTGHELIARADGKPVFGLTLPLVTTDEGDKFGKSAGNAIWLNEEKTSPFSLYQFFVRTSDAEVEKLLKLFTFIPINEISAIIKKHVESPEHRNAQKRLAEEVTLLVHGKAGLELAENVTSALYKGSVEALGKLSSKDVKQTFAGATYTELLMEPGISVLDITKKVKCFPTESDAMRIISAGGFYINQNRTTNISEVLTPGVHILPNGITLLRVGKKNYYIVKWLT